MRTFPRTQGHKRFFSRPIWMRRKVSGPYPVFGWTEVDSVDSSSTAEDRTWSPEIMRKSSRYAWDTMITAADDPQLRLLGVLQPDESYDGDFWSAYAERLLGRKLKGLWHTLRQDPRPL